MQKKLIALAVAGLVAAPAMAQSNVTIYGLVDVWVSRVSHRATTCRF
ncbi:porin [Hydrogenophilus thermoluteolus]